MLKFCTKTSTHTHTHLHIHDTIKRTVSLTNMHTFIYRLVIFEGNEIERLKLTKATKNPIKLKMVRALKGVKLFQPIYYMCVYMHTHVGKYLGTN